MRKRRLKIIYEGAMLVLVIISLAAMMTNEDSNFRYVHQIIWFIFLIDVVIRFIRTSVKWKYIKDNPFDIVTIIPLEESMILGRFARFLRLFRYKNIVKRYVDGISKKLEEIGFLRLSLGFLTVNIVITFSLMASQNLGFLESSIWVWGNFFKFNYESTFDDLAILAIIIKIAGIIYYGIAISEGMAYGRKKYEAWSKKKKLEQKVNKKVN